MFRKVQHHLLWREAVLVSFPLSVLRVTLAAYLWPRFIVFQGLVAKPLHARQGITAGIFSATCELKALLVRKLDELTVRHGNITFNMHVDDVTIDGHGKKRNEHLLRVEDAANDTAHVLEDQLLLPLATEKAAAVGNDSELVALCAKRLGEIGGRPAEVVRNLGIDFPSRGGTIRRWGGGGKSGGGGRTGKGVFIVIFCLMDYPPGGYPGG